MEKDKLIDTLDVVNGTPQTKQKKVKLALSLKIGRYTPVKTIMNNVEEFALFTGKKTQELTRLMTE